MPDGPRIYVYPADEWASGFYRLAGPAQALRQQGHDRISVIPPKHRDLYASVDQYGNIAHVSYPPDADVLVFQRITHPHLARAIGWLTARRKVPVVVDVDDDLSAIDQRNPAWAGLHPKTAMPGRQPQSWHATSLACRHATLVTVSTDALAVRYAPHGRVRVLHNRIPRSWLDIPHADSDVIGWPASLHSHPADPADARYGVSRVVRDGARFRVLSDPRGVGYAFGLDRDPEGHPPIPFNEWPYRVAELGIAIAPLADTRFNAAKSWLKPLEAAAVGVPWVGSARAEYVRLWRHGCGLIATSRKDWYRQLRRLLDSAALREDLSAAGRDIAAGLTMEGGADAWLDAWAAAAAARPAPVRT